MAQVRGWMWAKVSHVLYLIHKRMGFVPKRRLMSRLRNYAEDRRSFPRA